MWCGTMNFRIEHLHVYTKLVIIFITKMFIKKALICYNLSSFVQPHILPFPQAP